MSREKKECGAMGRREIGGARIAALAAMVLLIGGACPSFAHGSGSGLPAPDSQPTLIKNATILTVTHGTIEHGSILIRDGKIAAVGTDVDAPAMRR